MLNFFVAMKRVLFALFSFLLYSGLPVLLQQQEQVKVSAPIAGEALQGQIAILGTTALEGFQSFEVAYTYQQDTTNTWFLLYQGKEAVEDGELAVWDTTTISDGIYRLRVMVYLSDGRAVQTVVSGLRVRNYSPIETATAAHNAQTDGASTPTPADYVPEGAGRTPEQDLTNPGYLGNPAGLGVTDLSSTMALGGLIALGLFVLLGLYLVVRAVINRM
jgi:hypothetical protein